MILAQCYKHRPGVKTDASYLGESTEDRNGMTLVEFTVVVGAFAAFASIYTYIVIGAMMSDPWSGTF